MLINWLSGRATVTLFLTLLLAVVVVGAQQDKPKQNKLNAKTAYLADPSALVGCPSWALCNDPDRMAFGSYEHEQDCPPGYGMAVGETDSYESKQLYICYPCKSGFYSKGGMLACQPCGPGGGFGSPNGAAHSDQCFCLPGLGGPTCSLCLPGTFSIGGSLAPCCPCPNKANTTAGAQSEESCGCPPGRGGPTCEVCPVGTFGLGGTTDDGKANRDCETCPGNTTTVQEGSKSPAACVCAKGYAGPGCSQCTGDQICPGGSRDPPLRCPGGSFPTADAVTLQDCQCNAGFGRVDLKTSCDDCGICELCPPGSYGPGGFAACRTCAPGYTSPRGSGGSSDCTLCPTGTYEKDGVCLKCPFGTYSISTVTDPPISEAACNQKYCPKGFGARPCKGSAGGSCVECAPCPPGTYQDTNDFISCKPCNPGSTSLPGATNAGQCAPCAAGTYEDNGKCERCPLGSSSFGSTSGVESCTNCRPGFGMQPCPGKQGCVSCQPCPAGTYQDNNDFLARCVLCPDGMTSAVGSLSAGCFCKPGYGTNSNVCTLCPVGFFSRRKTDGSVECASCPANMITLQPGATDFSDCVCQAGYGWTGTACTVCTYPFYQGHLDENLVPVTSATKDNPYPPCLRCNLSPGFVIGNAGRQCLTGNGQGPAVYCTNMNNPLGVPFCPSAGCQNGQFVQQLACA